MAYVRPRGNWRGPLWSRRRFVRAAGLVGAGTLMSDATPALGDWWAGDLEHLLPAANHDRFAIKCSFQRAPEAAPLLRIAGRRIVGRQNDSLGRFFSFDVGSLENATEYELQLVDPAGSPLCDPWPLSTFPSPAAQPRSVRLLAYTCAGGHPGSGGDDPIFLPLRIRRRLLQRALSFRPHAAVAIGDHVYWDQRTSLYNRGEESGRRTREFYEQVGWLDLSQPAVGTSNEASLIAATRPQISQLYGVLMRSTPTYFVSDDHDYYENDDADQRMVTFPPDRYQIEFARFTRQAFLPEFLPDPHRPAALSGTGAGDRAPGISEAFGTFRYGRLAEVLIYDCARYLSLKGPHAGLAPPEAERWLLERTQDDSVSQLVHVPSHPFGWSAGKWREWYPDVADLDDDGPTVSRIGFENADRRYRLTTEREKYFWQKGWWLQHQRLLGALSAQKRRAVVLSGDLHAIGHAAIQKSGDLDLKRNPVHSVLTGPIGTRRAWPSVARGSAPQSAIGLEHEPLSDVDEKNGFTLLDMTSEEIRVRLFAWKTGEPEASIDSLEPHHDFVIRR